MELKCMKACKYASEIIKVWGSRQDLITLCANTMKK